MLSRGKKCTEGLHRWYFQHTHSVDIDNVMNSIYYLLFCLFCFAFWPYLEACKILLPRPGIEPLPLAVEAQNPNHWTSREFPYLCF